MKVIYKQNVNQLITEKYLRINNLSKDLKEEIIEQLFWVQENTQFTPQADVLYQGDGNWQKHLHREIFRALSRIECMLLLCSINEENRNDFYQEFISDQIEEDKLSLESFQTLSQLFTDFTQQQIEAQIRASVIASITLSPQARTQADNKLGVNNYPIDSVLFSGRTVSRIGDIYPIYEQVEETIKTKIQACFPDDPRHWRHAFFLENYSCLEPLKQEIEKCEAGKVEELRSSVQEWLNYWLINALGFNGHIKTLTGSEFMTESVYQRAMILNSVIIRLFEDPNLDLFQEYSRRCMQALSLDIGNTKLAALVLRVLNMANIFKEEKARELYEYIKQNHKAELIEEHWQAFSSEKIATYVPGLLQNVYVKSQGNFEILLEALSWINRTLEHSNTPIISFRLIAGETLQTLMNTHFDSEVQVNGEGEVILSQLSPSPR